MKKISFLFAIVACVTISQSLYAQKCKFDTDKQDDFTKEHVRSVKHMIGGIKENWWVILEQAGAKYAITVQISKTGRFEEISTKATKMLLKLENGTVISLESEEDSKPAYHWLGQDVMTDWLPKGYITEDKLKQLSESALTAIRINFANKDLDAPSISGKQAGKIQQSAACLLMKD